MFINLLVVMGAFLFSTVAAVAQDREIPVTSGGVHVSTRSENAFLSTREKDGSPNLNAIQSIETLAASPEHYSLKLFLEKMQKEMQLVKSSVQDSKIADALAPSGVELKSVSVDFHYFTAETGPHSQTEAHGILSKTFSLSQSIRCEGLPEAKEAIYLERIRAEFSLDFGTSLIKGDTVNYKMNTGKHFRFTKSEGWNDLVKFPVDLKVLSDFAQEKAKNIKKHCAESIQQEQQDSQVKDILKELGTRESAVSSERAI